jgi:outer membrane protein TolC
LANRNGAELARIFFRTSSVIGLCSVIVLGGCQDDLSAIDAQTDALMRERSERLGGGAIAPRPSGRGETAARSPYDTEPATVNPSASDLRFTPADEARDVERRLSGYSQISGEGAKVLDLAGVWRQAQLTGREFLTAEEEYTLAAIRLLIERHLWSPRFLATSTAQIAADNPISGDATTALRVINELRATQRLPYGGLVEARYVYTLTEQLRRAVGDRTTSSHQLVVTGTIPLLRGAGEAAREDLTQAERDLVYAARNFEDFRRSYLVSIANDYFDLVLLKAEIDNLETVLKLLRGLEERTRALVTAGRLAEFQLNIAASDVLRTVTGLASTRERYLLALDRFKVRLGLTVETDLEILPVDIGFPEPEVTVADATGAALQYRLDLQTRRDRVDDAARGIAVAKNQLLPDLNLFGSASVGTGTTPADRSLFRNGNDQEYIGGVTFGLPLDREIERLRLRQATIDAERAKRDLEEFRDRVIVDVRSAVRELDRARFNLDLARRSVYINQRRAEEQEIKKDEVTAQQVVETAQSLLEALNGRDRSLTDLRRTVLEYLLATGQLRAERDGSFLPPAGMDTTFKEVPPYTPPARTP